METIALQGILKTDKTVWFEHFGWISTMLFVVSTWVSPSVAGITFLMMVAAMLINIKRFWPIIRTDPMFWVGFLFLGYMFLSAFLANHANPDAEFDHPDAIWRFSSIFFFLPLAFWLKSDMKRIFWVIGLGCLSLVVGLIVCVDWTYWLEALQGQRIPLTRWGHITMGLYASLGLLGVLILGPRLIVYKGSRLTWLPRIVLTLMLATFFFQMILISQSRNIWIGILLIFPPLLFARYAYLLRTKTHQKSRKWLFVPSLLIAAALVLVMVHSYASIADRLSAEHEDFKRLARFETEGYSQYGFGVRILLNIYGFKKWKERPVFGWGPGADLKEFNHNHLHNSYLEVMVRFGIVGTAILVIYACLLIRALFWARSNNRMPRDLWLFLIGVYALTALFCLTDFRLTQMNFRLFWITIGGIGYTFYMFRHCSLNAECGTGSQHSRH